MRTLILHYMLHKKKVIAIGILLACYLTILIAIVVTNDSALDRLLYPKEVFLYYDIVSHQIMRVVLTALLATITFDFNSLYDEPLYAYFSKNKVVRLKMSVHIIIIIILCIFVNVLRLGIASFLYPAMDLSNFIVSFSIVYDMILLFFLMLLITPKRYRQTAFLMVAFYMLISIVLEDSTRIELYYILPFYHHMFSHYQLSIYYNIIYGLSLIFLVYLKEIHVA